MRGDGSVGRQWRGWGLLGYYVHFKAGLIAFADVLDMVDEKKKSQKTVKIFDLRRRWNCHHGI